ncbi:MAG: saccharopine dehydrogenase C-terminal domain-containing protein [Bacteroidia bacterium]|nr:saccharopine dehydrogenase C-terminal domain-containing protein [Bacteroidia bacterium]
MKHILVLGAGRSAPVLVSYLLDTCQREGWTLTLGDLSPELARDRIQGRPYAQSVAFDVQDETQREAEISRADVVVSLLPVMFHAYVARTCCKLGKHLLTASYVSDEIKALDADARRKGILILMECGLDPGIDHMSAMRVLDQIRAEGHELTAFETFTGGLITPESCLDNPWEYKFTWNPRNVVLAGNATVKFIQEGTYKYIPYHRLFRRTEVVHIPGYGYFEGYANRDSLKYLKLYNLEGIRTLYRGTFRRPGFSKAWDIFVQLGATDDSYYMEGVDKMTHRQFINSFLYYDPFNSVELKLAHYMGLDITSQEMYKLKWLGMFEDTPVGLEVGTPAQILEHILKKKWSLTDDDRDLVVMWHKFDFLDQGRPRQIQSHMVQTGLDTVETAMARTVGLPLGIAARLVATGQLRETGVHIPVSPALYHPILNELETYGIVFTERETQPS